MRDESCGARTMPAPSPAGPRVLPKVGLRILPSGGPNWSVLVKLKNSPAMISLRFSLTFVLLRIERSSLGSAGPRSRLQQYCPIVPKAGVANAAVLNQWSWLLIPALGSPMRLALPPKGELPFRESVPELTPMG